MLAEGLGFAAPLGAFGAALVFTLGNAALGRRQRGRDSVVALVLVGCLAAGTILASDVFGSGAGVETLLFGSLLLVDGGDVALAAFAAVATVAATLALGGRWLAQGFDPGVRPSGREALLLDAALLILIGLATVAALTVVGALLVSALFVVPAVTTRLFVRRVASWQLATVCLVALEGVLGLWLAVETDAPPGATIACVAGAGFLLAALVRALGRRRAPLLAAAALALVLPVVGCGGSDAGEGGRVSVVATTTQIGDWARQVGGDRVGVTQLLQPNSDPHGFEPRPSDVLAVANADLVLTNGDGLDGWAEEVVSDSGTDAAVVELGTVAPVRLDGGEEDETVDPHWWHDPRNVEAAVRETGLALAAAGPAHAGEFRRGAVAYVQRLRALDAAIARCVGSIPVAERKMVTDHDAFGYFANRYGIEVVGAVIPAQTTQAQPSAADLRDLVETIEAEGVRAIFPESSVNSKVADAIAAQTGASADHELYGDSLGPEGSDGATYLAMERANADAIVRGLSGGRRGCPASS